MRRNDLVGAVLRVTGGKGLSPAMAPEIIGEKANRAGSLRGLFNREGTEDLGYVSRLLREEEGYTDLPEDEIEAANVLTEWLAEGGKRRTPEDMVREAENNAEKEYRAMIRQMARRINQRLPKDGRIRTVGVRFEELEAAVNQAQEERRNNVLQKIRERAKRIGEKARRAYEDAIEGARSVLPDETFENLIEDELMRIPMDDETAYYRKATAIVMARTIEFINGEIHAGRHENEGRADEGRERGIHEPVAGRTEGDPENGGGREGASLDVGRERSEEESQALELTGETEAEAREAARQRETADSGLTKEQIDRDLAGDMIPTHDTYGDQKTED
jgi:hypothetical protein